MTFQNEGFHSEAGVFISFSALLRKEQGEKHQLRFTCEGLLLVQWSATFSPVTS